ISAAMLALCPSFVLPLPLFDPCYVMITCGLVGLWVLALRRNSIRASIGFGAVLAATLIVTFNVLVIGAFLAAFAIIGTELPPRRALARAAKHAAIAIGTCFILLTILWAMTGYNALAVFQTAWQLQHRLLALNPGTRPYPWTVIFDLWDFALGCGWILFVLAIFGLVRSARGDGWSNSTTKVLFACAAMPLLVALTHLLPGETARVWGFLLPFVLLPAAYELAHWTVTGRIVALACLWLALATISQNIWIVMPWA
ncbi:MAG TPA: hypothetical protein VL282_13175, partial [Tepidisphaeraceae bacterium]|nr:hypothetical protein [Tepidisphaeraceae bacterium]